MSASTRLPITSESGPTVGALLAVLAVRLAGSRTWRGAWVCVVVVLTTGTVLFSRAHSNAVPVLASALAVLGTAGLVLLLRWPLAAITIVAVANGAFVVVSRLPWPPTAVFAWLVAVSMAPLLVPRHQAVTVLVVTEAAIVAGAIVPASVNVRPWDAPLTEALAILLVWGAAAVAQQRRESEAARAALDVELRVLHERDVAARGRVAIARELHDVVAHHVSLIAVRAATAAYQIDDVSPAAQHAFDEIATQTRTALDELRSVLGILRAPEGRASNTPQPALADLPDLVQRMRAGGLSVEVRTVGTPRRIPDAAELCCYRVVQEALTNVMRHEPGAAAHVDLDYGQDLSITITNPVRTQPPGADQPTIGFGLTGMRERVFAAGGELRAGSHGGHFRVYLRIPAGSDATPP